jgi:hypothetical protein
VEAEVRREVGDLTRRFPFYSHLLNLPAPRAE